MIFSREGDQGRTYRQYQRLNEVSDEEWAFVDDAVKARMTEMGFVRGGSGGVVSMLTNLVDSWPMDTGSNVDQIGEHAAGTITGSSGVFWTMQTVISGPPTVGAGEHRSMFLNNGPMLINADMNAETEFSFQLWYNAQTSFSNNWALFSHCAVAGTFGIAWRTGPKFSVFYNTGAGKTYIDFPGIVAPSTGNTWYNMVVNVYDSGSDVVVELSSEGSAFASVTIPSTSIAAITSARPALNTDYDYLWGSNTKACTVGPFLLWTDKRTADDVETLQTAFYADLT